MNLKLAQNIAIVCNGLNHGLRKCNISHKLVYNSISVSLKCSHCFCFGLGELFLLLILLFHQRVSSHLCETIVNGGEWLRNLTKVFVVCFCSRFWP